MFCIEIPPIFIKANISKHELVEYKQELELPNKFKEGNIKPNKLFFSSAHIKNFVIVYFSKYLCNSKFRKCYLCFIMEYKLKDSRT